TVTLPALSGTLGWGTSALYTAGVLSVIDTNYLPGDVDRDGHVNVADVAAMAGALRDLNMYQATHGPGGSPLSSAQLISIGDLTGDGQVANADLQGLINYLASGGGSAALEFSAVPEPSAILLAAIGIVAILKGPDSLRLGPPNLDTQPAHG